jgi:DNA-binding GntR family transcriptional regulator
LAAGKVFSKRDEHAEHVAIFEAVIEGRTDDALRALEAHYTRTTELVSQQATSAQQAAAV